MNPNSHSVIYCTDLEVFLLCAAGLVTKGILFSADADELTITLTGGF